MGDARHKTANKTLIGPKKKIALVCSGGGSKAGAFHLGVALALQEAGFRFYGGTAPAEGPVPTPGPMDISAYVGSSAGSMISSYLASGYSLQNIFNSFAGKKATDPIDEYPKPLPKLTYQKMFKLRPEIAKEQLSQFLFIKNIFSDLVDGNLSSLLKFRWMKATGLFSTAGVEQFLRDDVLPTNEFKELLADLFIVATKLNHSRKVVFGKYNYQPPPHDLTCQYDNHCKISEAVAASIALPFIFAPYSIKSQDGQTHYYIDGEVRDTLSTHVAIDAGADLVIASYTHQPYHYAKEIGSLTEHGLPVILIQSIYLLIEQKINNHIHNKQIQREAITSVDRYCKDQGVSEHHRKRILEIMEAELHHRMDVDTIYIHPPASDPQMFIHEHFSLSPKKLTEIARCGFRAAAEILKRYEFADHKKQPPVGVASI